MAKKNNTVEREKMGKRIAYLRNKRKLTQKEFAEDFSEYIGRSRLFAVTTISAWETGRKIPSSKCISSIAEYFGVPADYINGSPNIGNAMTDESDATIKNQLYQEKEKLEKRLKVINELLEKF